MKISLTETNVVFFLKENLFFFKTVLLNLILGGFSHFNFFRSTISYEDYYAVSNKCHYQRISGKIVMRVGQIKTLKV